MGEQNVSVDSGEQQKQAFMRALLTDLQALEKMLDSGMIESGVRRIGAEQEMFLVDRNMRPASVSAAVLKTVEDRRFTPELAKFNLEVNLTPRNFEGHCLRLMEAEIDELIAKARKAAAVHDSDIILAGILPSLTLDDLTLANMSENPRYSELNRTLSELRRSKFYAHIKGLDEIHIAHDNMMLEACNTSFQIHTQVDPENFANMFNVAQAITGPVLAAAVNSPLLFGQRLWAETRLPLLQHSIDERSEIQHSRFRSARVSFGERWIKKSIIEIFQYNIARFRAILTHAIDEDPMEVLRRGETPQLSALRLYNGTIWVWNRPCYGILDGKPHLRIENRVLPAGPSILDEMANGAFFLGLMCSVFENYGPVDRLMDFDHAKSNFYTAARHGLDAQLHWFGKTTLPAAELILTHLLPLARKGLAQQNIAAEDIDRYLGTIEDRVRSKQTGAQWMLNSFARMAGNDSSEMRLSVLTEAIKTRQLSGAPVHTWSLPDKKELKKSGMNYRFVGQIMSTKLFTCHEDDIVDYVASLMHWEHLRHVLVEDRDGRLIGLVSTRHILPLLAQGSTLNRAHGVVVGAIMKRDLITVAPDTPTLDAVNIMRSTNVGCLPVVRDGKLVGILTLFELLRVSSNLLEAQLSPPTE